MNYLNLKRLCVMALILVSFYSLSYANYYRYIIPPDSVMAITRTADLNSCLNSESEIVKIWGIIRLGQIGHENDIDRLIRIYENEPDQLGFIPPPRVKYYSLVAIGETGGQEAEHAIMKIAENSDGWFEAGYFNIAAGICDALGKISSPTAIKTLESICTGQVNYGDRVYAQKNLYEIELRKSGCKTFGDSLNFLVDLMELTSIDITTPIYENRFNRREVEITFLDILNANNIRIFEDYFKGKRNYDTSISYLEKIAKLVRLGLKWHNGRYTLVDGWPGAVPTILSTAEIDSIFTEIRTIYYNWRFSSIYNVLLSDNADTSKFIDLLLNVLTMELESRRIFNYVSGSAPGSYSVIRTYIMYLVDNGKNYIPMLESIASKSQGDKSNWAIVALGTLRCATFKDKLTQIITYNRNPYMRMWAVRALSEFNDPHDYGIFIKALSDPFYYHVSSDVFLEDRTTTDYDNYIVRGEAFYALRNLGYSVSRDSTGNYHVEPEKK